MSKKSPLPSQAELLNLFCYDEQSGIIRWRVRRKGVNADMVAGVSNRGYIVVRVNGVLFRAHRLIWKLMTGNDPLDQIDHIDLNRSNNSWKNLRQADNSKNMMNAGLSSANTSGFKGVFWDSCCDRWRVRIKLNKKNHYVGVFKSFDEAVFEMNIARERLHGDFARAS